MDEPKSTRDSASKSNNDSSATDHLEAVMEEFMEQLRKGQTPSLSSFIEAYPQLATEIQELLPLVSMVEGAGRVPDPDAVWSSGKLPASIGGHTIIREIGRGGMGIVYEAEQVSPRRRIALKLLPIANNVTARERFRREAEAAAKMQHPNVIPVFEVGTTGHDVEGAMYYTMQLIDGFGLDQIRNEIGQLRSTTPKVETYSDVAESICANPRWCDRKSARLENSSTSSAALATGRLDIYYHNIALIVAHAAEAVHHAHVNSVIHRDIKPSNILVDRNGHVWVSDFGLAKFHDDELTQTGDIVGSIRYMSPERFSGHCDHRADIYSFGITLYEMLTLQSPFSSPDKLQIIKHICEREPTPPRQIDQRIPLDLETIVLKAIEKDPERRYRSCRELANDLNRFIHDEAIHARRLLPIAKGMRWARKNRLLTASLLSSFLACVVIIVGLSVWASTLARARLNAVALQKEADSAKQRAEAQSLVIEQNLYFSEMSSAIRSLESESGIGHAKKTIASWQKEDHPAISMGWEWDYIHSATHTEYAVFDAGVVNHAWNPFQPAPTLAVAYRRRIKIHDMDSDAQLFEKDFGENIQSIAWIGPDVLLVAERSGVMHTLNCKSGVVDEFLKLESQINRVSLGPDRRLLAVVTATQCIVIDLKSGDLIQTTKTDGRAFDWHPIDNRFLVSTSPYSYDILSIDPPSDRKSIRSASVINGLHWDHTGEHILVGGNAGNIAFANVDSPEVQSQRQHHRHYVLAIRCVPGTNLFASAGSDRLVKFWSADDELSVLTLRGAESYVYDIQFSADAQFVSAKGDAGTLRIWKLPAAIRETSPSRQTWSGCQHAIAVHPDSQDVAWVLGTNSIMLERIARDAEPTMIRLAEETPTARNAMSAIAWSPDGNFLAWATSLEFGLLRRSRESGEPLSQLETDWREQSDFGLFSLAWSPDGRHLARGGSGRFQIWDVSQRQVLFEEHLERIKVKSLAYSADGKWLASAGYGKARIYSAANYQFQRELNNHGITTRVAFAPDNRLAIASGQGMVEIFALPDGHLVGRLKGHDQDIFSVAWHPAGDRIATGSSDGTVRIWDADTCRQILAFQAKDSPILSVEWSRDGNTLASVSSHDGLTIRHASKSHR